MTPVVLWHPGTQVATADVAAGVDYGLRQHGVEIVPYATSAHISVAGAVLHQAWKQGKKTKPRPTQADVIYWASQGVLERALRAACERGAEWVIVVSGMYQHPDMLLMLRKAGLKVCVILTESPYDLLPEQRYVQLADVAFTNERTAVADLRNVQPHTYYLPHAWHPGVHQVAENSQTDVAAHDVVFVGTGFIERVKLLQAIDWTGVDFGLYGIWNLAGSRSPLRRHLRAEETTNATAAALYRRAKMGINLHRTSKGYGVHVEHVSGAESLNPRCFELAACGLPFTTDYRAEVAEVFGEALPTFTNATECEAILRRALADPAWRADMAATCRDRVAPHTWTARVATVLDVLSTFSAARAA